jgi:hypothetical protein
MGPPFAVVALMSDLTWTVCARSLTFCGRFVSNGNHNPHSQQMNDAPEGLRIGMARVTTRLLKTWTISGYSFAFPLGRVPPPTPTVESARSAQDAAREGFMAFPNLWILIPSWTSRFQPSSCSTLHTSVPCRIAIEPEFPFPPRKRRSRLDAEFDAFWDNALRYRLPICLDLTSLHAMPFPRMDSPFSVCHFPPPDLT